jgi:hypothetical protein
LRFKRVLGVWLPVLCANGVLEWDNDLRLYSLIPLGNCESADSKTSFSTANVHQLLHITS